VAYGLVSNTMRRMGRMMDRKLTHLDISLTGSGSTERSVLISRVEGHRYFTCRPSHGAFVRPDRVKTGDFPPVDEFADEEEL
jgi:hypothetical protein